MKCPKCGEEMEKGVLGSDGVRWQHKVSATFVKIVPQSIAGPFVWAWRCSKCGKVELNSEIN